MTTSDPQPEALVRAAERIAGRLGDGGRLLVDGHGRGVPDARHVVVEFMHPVTVGKRALSALEGTHDPRRHDVTMSIAYGGPRPTPGVDVTISDVEPAAESAAGDPDPISVELPCGDADASKVLAVLSYHVIWELVHHFLEAEIDADPAPPTASALYPMLYRSVDGESSGTVAVVRAAAMQSATAKVADSADVRDRALTANGDALAAAADIIRRAGSIFTFGNGGSSVDAVDTACRLGDRAHDLVQDVATITALANDVSFDVVFARQLATLGRSGDCAIAFSTSGNSSNLLEAASAAKRLGMSTIGFAGYDGGSMAASELFDVMIVVPSDSVHRIQEAQSYLTGRLATLAGV